MTTSTGWQDDAACRAADADLFFPVGSIGPALRQVDAAKRICRACSVRASCLAWALDHGIT
jgi:WhiB family transcriptional regulator, redox-sensing transcriptional regulator